MSQKSQSSKVGACELDYAACLIAGQIRILALSLNTASNPQWFLMPPKLAQPYLHADLIESFCREECELKKVCCHLFKSITVDIKKKYISGGKLCFNTHETGLHILKPDTEGMIERLLKEGDECLSKEEAQQIAVDRLRLENTFSAIDVQEQINELQNRVNRIDVPPVMNKSASSGNLPETEGLSDQLNKVLSEFEEFKKKNQNWRSHDLTKLFNLRVFNGTGDVATWVADFEQECKRFDLIRGREWIDALRFFTMGPAASWYKGYLRRAPNFNWDEWRDEIISTFACEDSTEFEAAVFTLYQPMYGNLVEFALKKEQDIMDSFPSMPEDARVGLIQIALPKNIKKQINFRTVKKMRALLNRLKHLTQLMASEQEQQSESEGNHTALAVQQRLEISQPSISSALPIMQPPSNSDLAVQLSESSTAAVTNMTNASFFAMPLMAENSASEGREMDLPAEKRQKTCEASSFAAATVADEAAIETVEKETPALTEFMNSLTSALAKDASNDEAQMQSEHTSTFEPTCDIGGDNKDFK